MEAISAIQARKRIRRYKADLVKEGDLKAVLEAARWAPSWNNTQCRRFIVVQNSVAEAKLADTINHGNPATSAIRDAPVVIAACAELGKAGLTHR